jgi:hypothetical protein
VPIILLITVIIMTAVRGRILDVTGGATDATTLKPLKNGEQDRVIVESIGRPVLFWKFRSQCISRSGDSSGAAIPSNRPLQSLISEKIGYIASLN